MCNVCFGWDSKGIKEGSLIDLLKICGSCARWQPEDQKNRPTSIRTINNGACKLSGKPRQAGDMQGCFGWKVAGEDELQRRSVKYVR